MSKPIHIWLAIIVAALGYFVDVFDLILFSVVRRKSLEDIGFTTAEQIENAGYLLINLQMLGMLIGGIIWGMLGDKRGRLSVLFGSILLYSLANIANGFANDLTTYGVVRFIAGLGLAGELGAGVTLVSELMSKEKRGYGTMIIATVGVSGAVAATYMAEAFSWRTCYFIGGGLGLMLLGLRFTVHESGLFKGLSTENVARGSFRLMFSNWKRANKYLSCVLMGMPTWFVVGLLVSFLPEFGAAMGMPLDDAGKVIGLDAGTALRYCYIGLTIGDFVSGAISQLLRSRKTVLLIFFLLTGIFMTMYLIQRNPSPIMMYWICGLLGFGVGFWAILVTVASESFGTNLRALSATTVPNFARGALVPLTAIYLSMKPGLGSLDAAAIVGSFALLCAFIGLYNLPETYGKELNYTEK
ncbi:MAG: MFS transporter [Flavobacteriales bacterium]|nr:MFS transporter [Flavobacteriales bacterium]